MRYDGRQTLLGGLEVMVLSKVGWDAACRRASLLFMVGGSGGPRLSSGCSARAEGSVGVSFCSEGSGWLLGRLLHPSDRDWELFCDEENSSPLQRRTDVMLQDVWQRTNRCARTSKH